MARIVIIDDESSIRSLLDRAMTAAGHEVFAAANGRAGMELVRQHDAELVITDIFMPEQEGVETIQEIRAVRPALPIIAISGGGRFEQHNLLQVAQALGANAALKKPFDIKELYEAVDAALGDEN